jgi:hypothetical protein
LSFSIHEINISTSVELTSLKIFKHYKLKPSFSIIKDDNAKDRAGVGDKPPPPNFGRLIWSNLTQFLYFIQFHLNQFCLIWSYLIQFGLLWSNFIKINLIKSNLVQFHLIWTSLFLLIWSDPVWSVWSK